MTEKIYYKDSYVSDFKANVISVSKCQNAYEIVLDKTAFFPEEGGQSSDKGYIGDAFVKDVYEKDSTIYHVTDKALPLGEAFCKVNFDERFDKMQQHTAEHILCGLIHSKYGYNNVGFHLGDDEVTFDIDHIISREELDEIELLANQAVFSNIKVETFFPNEEELESMEYRSKLTGTSGIRIVKIGDVDTCACCAPHVNFTGEIGIIKCFTIMSHRGGARITMMAGQRALNDYKEKYRNIRIISALLSEPQHSTATALEKYIKEKEKNDFELKTLKRVYAETKAENVKSKVNYVAVLDYVGIDELRDFANKAVDKVDGILVALSGSDSNYKYVIASKSVDLRIAAKEINIKLNGKGGGSPSMIQGSFFATMEDIKKYFENEQ